MSDSCQQVLKAEEEGEFGRKREKRAPAMQSMQLVNTTQIFSISFSTSIQREIQFLKSHKLL